MRRTTGLALVTAAMVVIAGAAGYWRGSAGGPHEPGGTRDGMAADAASGAARERKVLYYRNPMGLPDTSPVPKKDPMGMDYVPVYEGEAQNEPADPDAISISTDKVQKLGVRTEAAALRVVDRAVRAAGRVEADERRLYAISPKFEGYVERLHVNVTGQPVRRGQPLFEVYSPELVSAQREYALAAQGVEALKDAGGEARNGMKQLAESSLARLRNWDISEEQLKALAASGDPATSVDEANRVAALSVEGIGASAIPTPAQVTARYP